MAVPKQKNTKSRRNKRRQNIFIKRQGLKKCSKCGRPVLPHKVCFNCGYYKSREVLDVLKKLNKKEKKQKEKEIKEKEKEDKATEKKSLSWQELSKQ